MPLSELAIDAFVQIEWRVKLVFVAKGVGSIFGPSKLGKSFLAIAMGCANAEGKMWIVFKTQSAPVLYVSLEGNAGFPQRAKAWTTYYGRPLPKDFAAILQPFFAYIRTGHSRFGGCLPTGLRRNYRHFEPSMDENSGKDIGGIIAAASRFTTPNGLSDAHPRLSDSASRHAGRIA